MPVLWPLLGMMLVQAMTMLAVVTVPVLAPVLSSDLGIESSLVGIYQSTVFAGATLLTLFSGSLVRRHGGVRVNQMSLVIAVVALLLALDGQPTTLLACALGVGMGYGLATPGASHVLARVSPAARRGLVFSLKQSAVPVGGLIAGLLIPSVAKNYGWRAALVTVAVIISLAIVCVHPLRARLDDDRNPEFKITVSAPWQSVLLVLRTPALRPIAVVAFTFGAIQLCLFAFLVTFLVERLALTLVVAGTVFSVMQGAGVVARILWGWLSDHLATSRTLLAIIGVGIVVSTMTANEMTPQWPLFAIMLVAAVMGATAVGWNGIYLAEVARVVSREQVGAATGGVLMFTFIGIVAGPSTFGMLVKHTGQYTAGFALMNVLVAVAVVMLIFGKARSSTQSL
ncbi:MAG: MFS transporter [Gammaproteobacteria bacterium]|nr:MFS transporter [Gammaproteobacteria bacterium]MDH3412714.1 MFS transporter [Gammaproteobacteria bacterium]